MKFIASVFAVLSLALPSFGHRLDEYLQATIFTIEKDRVEAFIRLVPGVAVSSAVLAGIDTNADGNITEVEAQAYAQRLLHDLSLHIDGHSLTPTLVSINVPTFSEMREGLGEIQIDFTAALPAGGSTRKLTFENHHQPRLSAYLVNALVPRDKQIHIAAQNRNSNQSFYELDYSSYQ